LAPPRIAQKRGVAEGRREFEFTPSESEPRAGKRRKDARGELKRDNLCNPKKPLLRAAKKKGRFFRYSEVKKKGTISEEKRGGDPLAAKKRGEKKPELLEDLGERKGRLLSSRKGRDYVAAAREGGNQRNLSQKKERFAGKGKKTTEAA